MTLLTVSALGGAVFAHAQEVEVDENMVAAENLLLVLSERESDVTSLFEQIEIDGGEVPENAQEAFEEAQLLHVEAQTLFDEADYEEALEKATDALNEYGKAETRAVPEEPEPLTAEQHEAEAETEKMVGLFTAIEKAKDRIDNLRKIAGDLEIPEFETSPAGVLLSDAWTRLDEIKGLLVSGEYDEPEIILGEANRLIGQATGMIKSYGAPMKQEKVNQFIEQTMRRMGQLENKMNRIMDKRGLSNEGLTTQFAGIYAELGDLDTDGLTPDELKDLIRELRDIVKEANKVGKPEDDEEGLLDEETVEALNAQTDLETRIAEYRTQVESIEVNEENEDLVDELLGLLGEADGLLVQAEDAIGLEDEALAEELTEAAEVILGQFEELFDEFEDEVDTGNNGKSSSSKGKGKPTEDPEDPEETDN
jgi:hypothetical protein